jgi:Carboxypeptidase regulatory-like domain
MPRASLIILCLLISFSLSAQDAATGAIHGSVVDLHDLRIPGATIAIVSSATGARYSATSDAEGRFSLDLLPPGDYSARVVAEGMSPQITPQLHVDVGAAAELEFRLNVAGALEHVSVSAAPPWSILKPPPSPLSSTNAPSPISPSTAAASPTSCCSRPASPKIPAA